MSNVVGVGEVARRHHLTDPHRKVETSQDSGEDLQTRSQKAAAASLQANTHPGNVGSPVHVAHVIVGQPGKQVHQVLPDAIRGESTAPNGDEPRQPGKQLIVCVCVCVCVCVRTLTPSQLG